MSSISTGVDEPAPESPPEPTPAANAAQRLSAHEIFSTVVQGGRDELYRPLSALAFSAVAGGITIGLSALGVALMAAYFGESSTSHLLQAALYPVGFIAVIIGRAQFFTENTLFPVVTYMDDHRHGRRLLQFWGVVLGANLIGTALFAVLVMDSRALEPGPRAQLIALGMAASAGGFGATFWSAVIAGWLMALVAWMVSASSWTSGQILVVWLVTLLIGLGHFAHCVASSAEILSAVVAGHLSMAHYWRWLPAAVLGNIAGGVIIVSLLNYGQVRMGE